MKFDNVSCSQCGNDFGPGDHGFSHCENHATQPPEVADPVAPAVDERARFEKAFSDIYEPHEFAIDSVGDYVNDCLHDAWIGWHAAIKSMGGGEGYSRNKMREYAIAVLAAMQAGEPVAYWNGLKKAESNTGPWPTFSMEQDECTSIPLFTSHQVTSESDAMLAYAAAHGWPIRWVAPSGNGEDWGYIGGTGYANPLDAIRAAMKGAGS